MIIITDDLPNVKYHIKEKVSASSSKVKRGFFSRNISQNQYHKLQKQVNLYLARDAILNFHANAVIKTKYTLHHNKRIYYLTAFGTAVYSRTLSDSNDKINKELSNIGITNNEFEPLSASIDLDVYNALINNHYISDMKAIQRNSDASSSAKLIARSLQFNSIFKNLVTYHSQSITDQVMLDLFGLGAIQRIIAFNSHIINIKFDGKHLTYTDFHHHTSNVKFPLNKKNKALLKIWCSNLIHNPSMTAHKITSNKVTTYTGIYYLLHFKIVKDNRDKNAEYTFTVSDSALHQLISFHPDTKVISCVGDNIVVDYDFTNKNKHKTNKLTLEDTAKSLCHEVINASKHPLANQYPPVRKFYDEYHNGKIIYSRYADFNTMIISSQLTTNHKPLIVLFR